ncbi:Klarsicht protein [Formica fusca]
MTVDNTDHHKAKMNTSLTSLQPNSQSLERQKHVKTTTERLYNSLTKKRKDPKQTSVQRMWINYEDCKDDFWAAIRSNYDYIMDTNLIDTCKEANGELIWDETDVSTQSWNLKEVSSQFSELYSWLRILQELVYSKEENLLDKSLRAAHMEELRRKAYRRKLFNEQAEKLISRAPALKDEVAWRVDHLNAKWELVEQIMAPIDRPVSSQQDISADFEREVKCLRKWLRGMESRLQPLSFHINWTLPELEEKAIEHMVLQRDIKAHGRIVSSVVKLGDKVFTQQQEQEQQQKQQHQFSQPLQIARSLERRWHQLFLLSLEWQYHIETLVSRIRNKNAASCSSDSDEGPVTKQPRLSRGRSRGSGTESPGQSVRSRRTGRAKRVAEHNSGSEYFDHHSVSGARTDPSDSDASSENRSVGEGSYFEDELCQLCVMDAKSDEPAKQEATSSITSTAGDQGEEGDVEDNGVSVNDMPPTADTVPITTSTAAMQESCDEIDAAGTVQVKSTEKSNKGLRTKTELVKRCGATEVAASFNMSDRKSKNCATFYFKHLDTDSEVDCSQPIQESSNTVDDSSEEEWTYTSTRQNNSFIISEQRRTNVVVRLDFDESPRIAMSENMHFISAKNAEQRDNEREMSAERMHDHDAQQKDSDDERKNDKSSIQKLIKEVENLIGEERHTASRSFSPLVFEEKNITNNHRAKYARVKEWLKLNASRSYEGRSQPLDSCDASGEYTTEESDGERQSISSDDLQSSVATYRRFEGALGCISQSPSQEILYNFQKTPVNEVPPDENTPKVVMRSKQKVKGSRPWSVSCISQIGNNPNLAQINDPFLPFSISETALHQLVTTPPTKSVSLDATGTRKSFNSTSTLLEESLICPDDRVVRNISFRRKKNRLRKKTLGRKSESSSESVHVNHHSAGSDGSSNQQRSSRKMNLSRTMHTVPKENCHSRSTTLVKSGSFSGCTVYQQLHAETALANNSTPLRLLCCKPIASTSEIESEDHNYAQGHLASDNNILNNALNSKELTSQQLNVDSDVEMNSLGNNSLYEQAWDNYQEKYMSEAYSEPLDVEMARRLLDFGDDYRNFLDSQSECASSISAIPASSPLPKIRTYHEIGDSTEESDSDEENLRKIVENLQSQLILAENAFVRSNGVIPAELAEMESACKENLGCLQTVMDSQNGYLRNEKYSKQVRGMVERWETLASRVKQAQAAGPLHHMLATMRTNIKVIHDRLLNYEIVVEPHLLDDRINRIAADIAVLNDRKTAMLALNVSTHRLITDLGASAPLMCTTLKDGVADLYRIYDETFQKCNQQLRALQDVQQFGTCLAELQSALQRDKESLAVLDVAVQAGATPRITSSVSYYARLLSEKQDINCQNDAVLNDATTEEMHCVKFAATSASNLTQEGGSLSDSGISDGSGSEQELSKREHRLANLRRIRRNLEAQLGPGSKALVELWKRYEDAESDLRNLQEQCRELVVRTAAANMDTRATKRTAANQIHYPADKRKKASDHDADMPKSDAESVSITKDYADVAKGDNPDSEPIPRSWIWRIFKCSKSCCFVLVCLQVVLMCVEYFLKPNCCETTLSTLLSPTWSRDPKGLPPV